MGFGFNKGPLNLNNECIKSSQFCKKQNKILVLLKKIDEKKIEMMLIEYTHSKNIHNLKVVKILNFKNYEFI